MKTLEELEQMHQELGEQIQKLKAAKKIKEWPDTYYEAKKISHRWGMEAAGDRYMIVNVGNHGLPASASGQWVDEEEMEGYWLGDGIDDANFEYKLIPFYTDDDLYDWLMQG